MLHKTSFISFIRTCIDKIRGKKHKTPLEEFEEKFLKKGVISHKPTYIPIENISLYEEDEKNYDSSTVIRWAKQGKYNLPPEELKKQDKSSTLCIILQP